MGVILSNTSFTIQANGVSSDIRVSLGNPATLDNEMSIWFADTVID